MYAIAWFSPWIKLNFFLLVNHVQNDQNVKRKQLLLTSVLQFRVLSGRFIHGIFLCYLTACCTCIMCILLLFGVIFHRKFPYVFIRSLRIISASNLKVQLRHILQNQQRSFFSISCSEECSRSSCTDAQAQNAGCDGTEAPNDAATDIDASKYREVCACNVSDLTRY